MWIFSKSGFYSVVVDAQHEGFMLIRCRCAIDAANLYGQFHEELPTMTEPTSDETRDYRWRLGVSQDDWIRLAGRLAEQVTYSNFKEACHAEPSQQSKSSALLKIWSTMADIQRQERQGVSQGSDSDQWEEWIAKLEKQPKPPKRKVGKKAKKLF